MKGFNVKKLAAIATGAALLGTAVAPIVSAATNVTKDDIYSSNGSPKVNIVVGSNAAVSDAVWAGNLAAKIAEKAATTQNVTATVNDTDGSGVSASLDLSNLTIDVTVGGTVTFGAGSKEYKVNLSSGAGSASVEVPNANDTNALSDAQLPHLYNASLQQKVDNNNTTPTITEKIGVNVDAKFDSSSDIKDLVAYIEGGDFYYEVTLGSSGINLGSTSFTDGSDDNVKIIFFGEEYELSTASLTGTTNVKLVKSSAKESYNEGETIEGLVGDGDYAGEDVTVKLVQIVQSGAATTTYKATFELYDAEGNLVDTQTVNQGDNLRDIFKDDSGDEALRSNLFVDTVSVGSTTGTGYVEVTKGTDTLLLYTGKGYPYDATDTSGIYDYTVTLTTSGNSLTKIKVANSRDKWNNSTSSNGPLYPSNAGQSITGHASSAAVFGQALSSGTLGKGFAKAEFLGFESKEELTTLTVGTSSVVPNLDSSAEGGLSFRGADDAQHDIPLALELDDSESGSTFSFDTKTIWYDVNYGTSSTSGNNNDLNFTAVTGDFINGKAWTISHTGGGTGISTLTVGTSATILDVNDGEQVVIDGVTYHFHDANTGVATATSGVSVDGQVTFRKENSTGTLIYNTGGDTTDNSYGQMYFTDGFTFDAVDQNTTANLGVPGNGDRKVYYAVRAGQSINRLWLLLNADDLGADESDLIQNNKIVSFLGTRVPTDSAYTEVKGIPQNLFADGRGDSNSAGASGSGLFGYYVPQDSDFNSSDAYTNSNAYFVAYFTVDDAVSNGDFNVYVDTRDAGNLGPFTNTNLSALSTDLDFNGTPTWSLKSGSDSTFLSAGYTDAGAKAWLVESDDGVKISMPENAQKIQVIVSGADVNRTVTGDAVTGLTVGSTGTTDSGTKITVTAVNGGSCDLTGSGGSAVCVANPSSVMVSADVKNPLVYLDTDQPSGTNVVIGGHVVNRLAAGLADRLTAPGNMVAEVDATSGDIFLAGYTAEDTGRAVKELIDEIDSWQ